MRVLQSKLLALLLWTAVHIVVAARKGCVELLVKLSGCLGCC